MSSTFIGLKINKQEPKIQTKKSENNTKTETKK